MYNSIHAIVLHQGSLARISSNQKWSFEHVSSNSPTSTDRAHFIHSLSYHNLITNFLSKQYAPIHPSGIATVASLAVVSGDGHDVAFLDHGTTITKAATLKLFLTLNN